MARTAVVAVSKKGVALARQLGGGNLADADIFLERRLVEPGDQVQAFDLPLRPLIGKLFQEYQALVLFLPVGAVVRLIAPILQDKHQDPAVVCVDDAGRFAVSLVSGHVGGADRLAEQVAEILNATPVITSASHVTGTLAVDLLGQEFGWTIEADPVSVTRASAAVVNGEPVGVFQEAGETSWWPDDLLPDNITRYPSLASLAQSPSVAALVISDRVPPQADGGNFPQVLSGKIVILYRPASLVVGLGCRRGVPAEELEQLLLGNLRAASSID